MRPDENRRYHLLTKECGLGEDDKEALLHSFSDGRATSSKDLTPTEAKALLDYLQSEHSKLCKKMRGKIIHYLCLLGYVTSDDSADWDRINAFIVDIGSNNPRRVILNFLYYSELPAVVSQVEAMYRNETKRVTKK
jgi:hypothetical protein